MATDGHCFPRLHDSLRWVKNDTFSQRRISFVECWDTKMKLIRNTKTNWNLQMPIFLIDGPIITMLEKCFNIRTHTPDKTMQKMWTTIKLWLQNKQQRLSKHYLKKEQAKTNVKKTIKEQIKIVSDDAQMVWMEITRARNLMVCQKHFMLSLHSRVSLSCRGKDVWCFTKHSRENVCWFSNRKRLSSSRKTL